MSAALGRVSARLCVFAGEKPHGLFHGMHGHHRMYRPFLMRCADEIDNPQIKEDPTVSELNVTQFFWLNVMVPACGEYILELGRDPAAEDWTNSTLYIAKAESNINFAWLCHFLHDAGFWVLDFHQQVRGNKSKELDTLWAEFFAVAHSGTAHKTQYVGMALLRVFWGQCLHPDLAAVYEAIRTIPTGSHDGCGVGWDHPIEALNHAIKSHVDMHVSETQIDAFVDNWAFIETVQAHLREILYAKRADRHWRGRNARADIEKLKQFFRDKIGSTWAEATRPCQTLKVTAGPDRAARAPWLEVAGVLSRRGNDACHVYIREYVTRMTPYFEWKP